MPTKREDRRTQSLAVKIDRRLVVAFAAACKLSGEAQDKCLMPAVRAKIVEVFGEEGLVKVDAAMEVDRRLWEDEKARRKRKRDQKKGAPVF